MLSASKGAKSLLQLVRSAKVSANTRAFSTEAPAAPLFGKLLVANRGEIACRIFRTCRKLGIKTVAVYSEADANSQHVKLADEAICIGPAPALQSYLLPERILAACKLTGANAVHPGYGFLSENYHFAEMLHNNGIKFVGPRHETIKEMADKINAKTVAEKAHVKPIPGFIGAIRDEAHLIEVANGIGYPVMVKAAHGGGGKGMRRANNDEECRAGYRLSVNEARTAFNSSVMLVEKFIEDPRHIEFQVLGDSQGNAVFVHERECSVQRRNQKLVEEAPSTFLNEEQRARIGAEAVAIAKISGYENAGTVEFLMGRDGQHYYLEMNTRLQVEHPITEMISGLDLVEQQIRVAAGLPLPFVQDDIKINGWSVETRVCAEDPLNDFLPSIGTLTRFEPPTEPRVDLGFVEGDKISIHYDSLLAKVITHAPTRKQALAEMERALDATVIQGLSHNICFLREVMQHPKFVAGQLTTNFIADNFPHGFTGHKVTDEELTALISGALVVALKAIMKSTLGVRALTPDAATRAFEANAHNLVVSAVLEGKERFFFCVPGAVHPMTTEGSFSYVEIPAVNAFPSEETELRTVDFNTNYDPSRTVFDLRIDGSKEFHTLQATSVQKNGSEIQLSFMGSPYQFTVNSWIEAAFKPMMPVKEQVDLTKSILSPMPGSIFSLNVKPGDKVVGGQELLVIEAMKMQNSIRAAKPATVKAVHAKQGDTVAADQLIIELE